jgi:hypothetical protein
MATIKELQEKIAKLEKGINSKATSTTAKAKMRTQVKNFKSDIADLKAKSKPTSSKVSKAKEISKEIKRKYSKSRPFGKSDIYQDAVRPAKRIGKRTSAEGNTYYEYRENRTDRKQPPRKYPRLADGGEVGNWYKEGSDKWGLEKSDTFIKENNGKYDVHLRTFNNKTNKWGYRVHSFDTLQEAKEDGYSDSIYADGGALDLLADTSGAGLQNVGGSSFSNVDLTPQMDITNPMFANGGELHRSQDGMYAKGGMTEHGLKRGDEIIDDQFWDNSIVVRNRKDGTQAIVYLSTGKRKESKM